MDDLESLELADCSDLPWLASLSVRAGPCRVPARRDELMARIRRRRCPRATAGRCATSRSATTVVEVDLEPATGNARRRPGGPDGVVRYRRVGIAATPYGPLTLWWIEAYGGGLFLPVRDGTSGRETYGGGRYLTDTVKGTFGRGVVRLGRPAAAGLQLRVQPRVPTPPNGCARSLRRRTASRRRSAPES